jgi:hypothetical protein
LEEWLWCYNLNIFFNNDEKGYSFFFNFLLYSVQYWYICCSLLVSFLNPLFWCHSSSLVAQKAFGCGSINSIKHSRSPLAAALAVLAAAAAAVALLVGVGTDTS